MRRSAVLVSVTVGFALLYLAATATLGSPPDASDNAATVASWFSAHGGNVRGWLWLLTLGLPLFAAYAAMVRIVLPAPHRDIFFAGAIAFVAETAVQGWLWGGLALRADTTSPSTTHVLFAVAAYWGPVLTSTTIMMLAPVAVLALDRRTGWPRWVGVLAALAAVEQLAETVTVFGKAGFIAPGGPMNIYLGAGATAVALIAVGVAAAQRGPAPTPASTRTPHLVET